MKLLHILPVLWLCVLPVGITYEIGLSNGTQDVSETRVATRHPSKPRRRDSSWKKARFLPIDALGKNLYFDKRLSNDGTVSCSTCHDPAIAFASRDVVAIGIQNLNGTRNAPTLLNAKFNNSYFWDGRARTLEEQAKEPLLNPKEMGMETEAALVARVASIPEYRELFGQVFGRQGITLNNIAKAIAAYERTLLSNDSPFDRFIAGNPNAVTEAQKRGWKLFQGKAECISCHTFSANSSLFTDLKFYNTGVGVIDFSRSVSSMKENVTNDINSYAHTEGISELGRYLVTRQPKDIGAYKTPTLRDVELTFPYMHNGSIRTLLDVVRFYNEGGRKNPYLDSKIHPLKLTDSEMSEIVEFLRALTSDDVLRQTQNSKPQNRESVPILKTNTGYNP